MENLLTAEQVAEKLQLNVETVYRWLKSGKLKGMRISARAWRVTEKALDDLLEVSK